MEEENENITEKKSLENVELQNKVLKKIIKRFKELNITISKPNNINEKKKSDKDTDAN